MNKQASRVKKPEADDRGLEVMSRISQISGAAAMTVESKHIPIKGEILRKLTHIGALSIPVSYYFLGETIALPLLGLALLASLTIEMIRFFGTDKIKDTTHRLVGIMIRPHEKKDFTGATYILCSSIIAILIFDKMIAILAIAYIVVGDTAGAIVGRLWGKIKLRNRTLEGSLSFFLSCCLVALVIPGVPLWIKIIGALTAAVVEALTFYLDDNLTVPIVAGALMQYLSK